VGPFGATACKQWSEEAAHVGFACRTEMRGARLRARKGMRLCDMAMELCVQRLRRRGFGMEPYLAFLRGGCSLGVSLVRARCG
jgi:hypothetical protein